VSTSFQFLHRSDVLENSQGFASAMKQGFFYLEIPEEIKPLIQAGVHFGNHFYQDPEIQKIAFGGLNGLHVRDGVQAESFYLEEKYWSSILSAELSVLAEKMEQLCVEILCGVLKGTKIDSNDWTQATGGASSGQGMCHFSFNHYRPGASGKGLKEHRDFGHVTLLFINRKGLQASVENEWRDVDPMEGYLIVNFGASLEMLVNDSSRLTAAIHRVQRVSEDRISFGIFLDSTMESALYKANQEGGLERMNMSYAEYIEKQFKVAYDVSKEEFDVNIS
jgi:hypothetical protein